MEKIAGNTIVLADRLLRDSSIVVEDSKIVAIESGTGGAEDFKNSIILPGFIDLHTHGRLGQDTEQMDTDMLLKYAQTGTTSFTPTYCEASIEETIKWLNTVKELKKSNPQGVAEILWAHVEGPFIDPPNRGGFKEEDCLLPTDEMVDEFLRSPVFKYMTVSPYVEGAINVIKRLSEAGIICVSGHSRGSDELFEEAYRAGLKGICHFFNNNDLHDDVYKEGGVRKPTLDEAALLYDDVFLEIICDLQHVDLVFIKLAYKLKGPGRIAVVTDSISAAGLPDGVYTYHDGRKYELKDGGVHECEGGGRFGSCVTQVMEFANLVDTLGISYIDATRMCALTPAEILGVDSRKGSLESGKDADIIVVNRDTFEIEAVFVKGHRVRM